MLSFIAAVAGERTAQVTTDARIAVLESRLKQSPDDNSLRDQLTGEFIQKLRETADAVYLDRASKMVAAILAKDPSNYPARRRNVEIEMHRHRFKDVIALCEVLVKERPEDSVVWGLIGDALMERGEYDGAADAYQKMVDLRPGLASYNRIAFFRFVTGDAEGAIQAMEMAVRAGSPAPENLAWCYVELGTMLFKTGSLDQAEEEFQTALALFQGYHRALAGLARVRRVQGRLDEAIRLLLDAQSRVPYPEYAGMLASLYRKTGKSALAARQIALLDVSDKLGRAAGETANRNLALAFADLGHWPERALELAQAELNVRADVYTYDALAWALFRNGQTAEATTAMDKALAQRTPEPAFHAHAARIFDAAGREQEARFYRERANPFEF